jgi:hypothetical protein
MTHEPGTPDTVEFDHETHTDLMTGGTESTGYVYPWARPEGERPQDRFVRSWQVHVTEDGHLVRDRIGPRVIVVGIRPDYEVEIDAAGVGAVGDWAQREVDSETVRARHLADLLRRAEHLTDAALRAVPDAPAFRVEGVNAGTGRALLACDVCSWYGYHVSRMIGGGVPVSGDTVRLEGNSIHFKYASLDSLTTAAAAHRCPPEVRSEQALALEARGIRGAAS